jgi:hypothetical protein
MSSQAYAPQKRTKEHKNYKDTNNPVGSQPPSNKDIKKDKVAKKEKSHSNLTDSSSSSDRVKTSKSAKVKKTTSYQPSGYYSSGYPPGYPYGYQSSGLGHNALQSDSGYQSFPFPLGQVISDSSYQPSGHDALLNENHDLWGNCVFIFPKMFEFINFALLCDKVTCGHSGDYYCTLDRHHFTCVCIQEPEYEFSELLVARINRYKSAANIKGQMFVLMGCCGTSELSGYHQWYFIENAHQADRGYLNERNEFKYRKGRVLSKRARLNNGSVELSLASWRKMEICSSNFLNSAAYNLDVDGKVIGGHLYDMETYYFYSICSQLDVKSYFAFRYATDIVHDGPFEVPAQHHHKKLGHKHKKEKHNHIDEVLPLLDDSTRPHPHCAQCRKLLRVTLGIDYTDIVKLITTTNAEFFSNRGTRHGDTRNMELQMLYRRQVIEKAVRSCYKKKGDNEQSIASITERLYQRWCDEMLRRRDYIATLHPPHGPAHGPAHGRVHGHEHGHVKHEHGHSKHDSKYDKDRSDYVTDEIIPIKGQ